MATNKSTLQITEYSGPKDSEGKPHGYGTAYYKDGSQEFRYVGMFRHGKRHGFGELTSKGTKENPQEEWQWYQEGDYDSAGRLIHPLHEPGSYTKYIETWWWEYSGWWREDQQAEDETDVDRYDAYVTDFEITHDDEFLSHFYDFRFAGRLSPEMVEKLSKSSDPYARYAYGHWLYNTKYDDWGLIQITECFKYAANHGIADALYMLSLLYRKGDVYNPSSTTYIRDTALAKQLYDEALERGSMLAKLHHNFHQFEGLNFVDKDQKAALAEAEAEANKSDASVYWIEQLGTFYNELKRYDEAIEAYERCILRGYYQPIIDLALIHLYTDQNSYYEALMREGIRRKVSQCLILGIENQHEWDNLHPRRQASLSTELRLNLNEGVELNNGFCAYLIGHMHYYRQFGFWQSTSRALEYALKGYKHRCIEAMELACTILQDEECDSEMLSKLHVTERDILMLNLRALRYGVESVLETVIENEEKYVQMGYGDEIKSVWIPKWLDSNENSSNNESDNKSGKKSSWMIAIHPSGDVEFVDLSNSDYDYDDIPESDIAELLDAEHVTTTTYSEVLDRINEECNLSDRLTLFYDSDTDNNELELNPTATILDNMSDIRGAAILLLQDDDYNNHSFKSLEQVKAIFNLLVEITDGGVRLSDGNDDEEENDDDGRYDAWA